MGVVRTGQTESEIIWILKFVILARGGGGYEREEREERRKEGKGRERGRRRGLGLEGAFAIN